MDLVSKEDIIDAMIDLGLSPADLQDEFDESRQEEIDMAREALVDATANYVEVLEPSITVSDEETAALSEILKDLEKTIERSKRDAVIEVVDDFDKKKIFAFLNALGL